MLTHIGIDKIISIVGV